MPSCFYCGDDSQITRDHVKPSSYQEVSRSYSRSATVPCCRECNQTLGAQPVHTLEERSAYLFDAYTCKYRKCLKVPDRSESELTEYGPRLRSTIEANMLQKRYILERLDTLSKVSVGLFHESANNLKGVTTLDKAVSYRILVEFLRWDGTIKSFVERQVDIHSLDHKRVESIIDEKYDYDVALTLKMERRYPLELPVKNIRRSLKSLR